MLLFLFPQRKESGGNKKNSYPTKLYLALNIKLILVLNGI